MRAWIVTKTGVGRADGRGAVIDLSVHGARGYVPRVRLADGTLVSLVPRETLGAAQAAVLRFAGAQEIPPAEMPDNPNKETSMSEIAVLTAQIAALAAQVAKLTPAGPPEERREKQAEVQAEKRVAVWIDLGAPNGYIHPSQRAKVEWNGRRWVAYVDGTRLRKTYRKSFNARVAAGIKLSKAAYGHVA